MKSAPRSILFLALPTLLCGQVKHTPTLDEMSLKTISPPKISPDGRFVAYRMRETNLRRAFTPGERIPEEIDGVPIRTGNVGNIHKLPA